MITKYTFGIKVVEIKNSFTIKFDGVKNDSLEDVRIWIIISA